MTTESETDEVRDRANRGYCSIETTVWQPKADGSGYLEKVRTKTIGEVFGEVLMHLEEYPAGAEEYFSLGVNVDPETEWPEGRIICYSVNGSSEGNYVHCDVQTAAQIDYRTGTQTSTYTPIFLGKSFMGRDASWAFARRLADLLEIQ